MSSDILTKSQFARDVIRRDPAFVTRAIAVGKLHGGALIGEGRSARIRVSVAIQQLADVLDVAQQLAQPNPILPSEEATGDLLAGHEVAAAADAAPSVATKGASSEHLALKNLKLRLDIERQQVADAVRDGQLVEASAVAIAVRRQLAPLVAVFDELGPAVAKVVAEQFGLDYPAVLIAVNGATRSQRQSFAERARSLGAVATTAAEAEAA